MVSVLSNDLFKEGFFLYWMPTIRKIVNLIKVVFSWINKRKELKYVVERLHRIFIQVILVMQCGPYIMLMVIIHVIYLGFLRLEYKFANQCENRFSTYSSCQVTS